MEKKYFGNKQKEILIYISENAPKSIREISELPKGSDYKNVYDNIKKFEKRGLVKKKGEYWLTLRGVKEALLLGANPVKVKKLAPKYLSGNDLQLTFQLCDYIKISGIDMAKGVISLITENRFVFPIDLGRDYDKNAEELGEFINKYEGYKEPIKDQIKIIMKKLGLE